MLKVAPILFALVYGYVYYRFSAWRLARELDEQSKLLQDPELGVITDKMAAALDLAAIKVHIYDVEPINGLAAPDGRIFITRGFYEKFKAGAVSAEEIATVIAHELGHVALGHARRRMIDFSGQNAIRVALGMVLGRILPGIGGWIAGILTSLLAARLSRKDEFEADAYAAALLTKTGIGVGPQVSLFEKLDALAGQGVRPPAWLMSHPKTEKRIEAIEALARSWDDAPLKPGPKS